MRKVGIFGGTFNPPHIGHLEVARIAKAELMLDELFWVPTNIPNLKDNPQVDVDLRIERLLGFLTEKHLEDKVSLVDIERGGVTYAIDTVADFKLQNPDAELFFIFGADVLQNITAWHQINDLVNEVQMVCVARPGYDMAALLEKIPLFIINKLIVINANTPDISSTALRDLAAQS